MDTALIHTDAMDVSNMILTFNGDAFTSGTTSGYSNLSAALSVNFKDNPAVTDSDFEITSTVPFAETASDDGEVGGAIVLTLVGGDSLSGVIGSDLVDLEYVRGVNIPDGLELSVIKNSHTQATISLKGNAENHEDANDINVGWFFEDSAFVYLDADQIDFSNTTSLIEIDFQTIIVEIENSDFIEISNTGFTESNTNDGSVEGSIVLSLVGGDQLTGANGDDLVATGLVIADGVPSGLSLSIIQDTPLQITISLTGNAAAHKATDNATFGWTFTDNAFEILAASIIDYAINPNSQSITFTTETPPPFTDSDFQIVSTIPFIEQVVDNGIVNGEIVLNLAGGDTLTGKIGDDFVTDAKLLTQNIPNGLTLSAIKNSSTQITLRLNGVAVDHSSANRTFGWTFTDNAFAALPAEVVELAQVSSVGIEFHDGYTPELTFTTSRKNDSTTFYEVIPYVGGLGNAYIQFRLSYDTFVDTIENYISIDNLPAGIKPVITKNTNSLLTITFDSIAANHAPSDSTIANITFEDGAFTGYPNTDVAGYQQDISIKFQEYQGLAYDSTRLVENKRNDGSIDGEVKITLLGGQKFTGFNGELFSSNGKVLFTYVPDGLNGRIERISETEALLSFTGNATAHSKLVDDISNVIISFQDIAFTNPEGPPLVHKLVNDFAIEYVNTPEGPTFTFNTKKFNESSEDDGSIDNQVMISLYNATFHDDLSIDNVSINNLPSDYTMSLERVTSTQAILSLSGTSLLHFKENNIDNLEINFIDNDVAVVNEFSIDSVEDHSFISSITYQEKYGLYWDEMAFYEDTINFDGAIVSSQIIRIGGGETFVGTTGDNLIQYTNYANFPNGLTPVLERISDTKVQLFFTGIAHHHDYINTAYDGGIIFNAAAFTKNTVNYLKDISHLNIQFHYEDTPGLSWSKINLAESFNFDGSVADTVLISAQGRATFTANSTDFITDELVTITGVPDGLTANLIVVDQKNLKLYFNGNATSHLDTDDIDNLNVTFNSTAFENNDISNFGKVFQTLSINFRDSAPYLTWSNGLFTEANTDDGSVEGTMTVNLVGDAFVDAVGTEITGITTENTPDGLTPVLTVTSSTSAALTFTGNATEHKDINDSEDFLITFSASAFVASDVSTFIGLANTDYPIRFNFNDTPITASEFEILSFAAFKESKDNDGSVDGELVLQLTGGDVLTGINGQNLVKQNLVTPVNVPSGLFLKVIQNSATQVTISFVGNASSEQNTITFGWEFTDNAFANLTAAEINLAVNRKAYQIEFSDPNQSNFDGENWSNGSPSKTTNVVIDENATLNVSSPINVNSISLSPGSKINIAENGGLTVSGDVVNYGVIKIANGGYIIQEENSDYLGTGTVEYTIVGDGLETVYNYFSSPYVSEQSFGGNIYSYNPTLPQSNSYSELNKGWQAHNGAMTPGQGYTATNVDQEVLSGTPNNGDINVSVYKGAHTGFNLIGNPYLSPIDIDKFVALNGPDDNNVIEPTIYLWDQDISDENNFQSADYATYKPGIGAVAGGSTETPNGEIAVGQGFYIEAKSSGTVIFRNSMRSTDNSQFFRVKESNEVARLWLNVHHENSSFNQTLIAFKDNADDLYDPTLDVKKLVGNTNFTLYSQIENEDDKYVINVFNNFAIDEKEIALGLVTSFDGEHEFELADYDHLENFPILLVDNKTGLEYNLKEESVKIYLPKGDYSDRFTMKFREANVLSNRTTLEEVLLGTSHGKLHLLTNQLVSVLKVFDLNGQEILQLKDLSPNSTIDHQLDKGIYIIQIQQENTIETQKIVLK
ncbi:T9SS type A sorting domain-containing protein [Flammeovirga pectinis]|uniref:T9SS type A sorting domain-containing protein n=1 Tax=Flammeovirga pectinis TaxID=2494373 RepID=A0A3Q9FMV2_9BACT|nr:T9SS type A sorting domain-containing protein [Flammeovirga pectinis]AZQ63766.1 T9SS type A sorting domain-containing protein [Flammeovirga pectinis]